MRDNDPHGTGEVTRRNALRIAGLGTTTLIAGCTGGDNSPNSQENSNTQNNSEEADIQENASFVEGIQGNPDHLDIHGSPSVSVAMVLDSLHDTLFMVGPDLEIRPHLVEEYESTDNSTQYDFYLKEGITFHNGNELTAMDAAWTFERLLDISPESYLLGPVTNIDAIDDYHLQLEYDEPFPLLPRNLTSSYTGLASPEAVEEAGDAYGQEAVIGTGPFEFVEWERDQEIILTRFDEYDWGPNFAQNKGPAHVEELRIRIIPETTTLFNEVTVGNVHGTPEPAEGDASQIEEHENTQLERTEFPHPNYLAFNTERPPTDDVNVRRAIAHALNREAIISSALDGEGYPIWNLVPPLSINSLNEEEARELGHQYDPDRARELLDEAGWTNSSEGETRSKDGEPLEMYMTAFNLTRYAQIGKVVQAMLENVGIRINLEILEGGTLYDRLEGSEHNITTMAWSRSKYALEVLEPTLTSENVATEGGTNYSIWRNDEFDSLVEKATTSPEESDRQEAIHNAQRLILEEVPVAPIMGYMKFYGYKNEVQVEDWFDHPWWADIHTLHRLEASIN